MDRVVSIREEEREREKERKRKRERDLTESLCVVVTITSHRGRDPVIYLYTLKGIGSGNKWLLDPAAASDLQV